MTGPRTTAGSVIATVEASWRWQAACRDRVQRPEDDLWFGATALDGQAEHYRLARKRVQAAKRICANCPAQAECLAFALATRQRHGVWGGHSEAELARLRRGGRRRARRLRGTDRNLGTATA